MVGEEKLSTKKIKSAYRKLAMKYHPDLPTGDHQKFVRINLAKEYLLKYR
ncbi:MAG: DnaJ domain-containing protein [Flavobacteriaceae bacterium]|nr:DnaJ domain-containing protein [Flavobacteriaceae bacterium]